MLKCFIALGLFGAVALIISDRIRSSHSLPAQLEGNEEFLTNLSDPYNYKDTLIVENTNSPDSVAIVNYFLQARAGIPGIGSGNVVHITTGTGERISMEDYIATIKHPLEATIKNHDDSDSDHPINYIMLTKGIPIYASLEPDDYPYSIDDFYDGIFPSVDSLLAACLGKPDTGSCDPSYSYYGKELYGRYVHFPYSVLNPYFHSSAPFSHAAYNMYLVTHLTGYTVQDVERLIDRSAGTAVGSGETLKQNGLFVLDGRGRGEDDGFETVYQTLLVKGFRAMYDLVAAPILGQHNVIGYWSWGSNAFDMSTLTYPPWPPGNTWGSGSIAETAVSTSARTFVFDKDSRIYNDPQSLIADLIHEGVAAVKGYVSEPSSTALAWPADLFGHYTDGYNMAESFYAASQLIHWSDIIVGDPKMFIVPSLPPTNTSPARTEPTTTNPTFSWQRARSYFGGNIDHYELWVDGVKQGANIPADTTSVQPSMHYQKASSTARNTPHTWYVKAIDSNGGVLTSSGTTFFVATIVTPVVHRRLFFGSTVIGQPTLTIKWSPAQSEFGIAKYQLFINNADAPYLDDITGTGVTIQNTLPVGRLPLFVRAVDNQGNTADSTPAYINLIDHVPSYPPNPSVETTLSPTFYWAKSDGCTSGQNNLAIDCVSGNPCDVSNPAATCQFFTVDCDRSFMLPVPSSLMHGTWSTCTWGNGKYFYLVPSIPPISLNAPSSGSLVTTATPTFSWEPTDGYSNYRFYIDGSLAKGYIPDTRSVTPSMSLTNGTHTWFVTATDSHSQAQGGDEDYLVVTSSLFAFTVAVPELPESSSSSSISSTPIRRSGGGGGGGTSTPLKRAAGSSSSASSSSSSSSVQIPSLPKTKTVDSCSHLPPLRQRVCERQRKRNHSFSSSSSSANAMLYRVRAEILNLRTDPTITAAVRSVLLKGETFTVLRFVQNNQWAQVRLSNGREGYVFAPYIEKVNP